MKANPTLYEVDTRDWLHRISLTLGRPATLDDVSDAELDAFSTFDWVWLLGVWQTGDAGRKVSNSMEAWRPSYIEAAPDLQPEDICGSTFAVRGYEVAQAHGGNAALQRIRERLRKRGISLMLDLVPNHTAIDHPWVTAHADYYMPTSEEDLARDPQNHVRVGSQVFAHGRDPNFPGWPDTLQLNYANSALQRAMVGELHRIATMCDGVRCDMAMLLLPEVFKRTWNLDMVHFWGPAIAAVRAVNKSFVLMAEVYWGLEWQLQQLGFDYTYDKELYDRLVHGSASTVRGHLTAAADYQHHSVRFLENHDEPRAAAVFDPAKHRAAAMITYFVPGLRFFHHGQLQGFHHKPSCHLRRRFAEDCDPTVEAFYSNVVALTRDEVFQGEWSLLDVESSDPEHSILCFFWRNNASAAVIAVNFASYDARGKVKLPFASSRASAFKMQTASDNAVAMSETCATLELPPWGYVLLRPGS